MGIKPDVLDAMNEGEKQLYFICEKYIEQGYYLLPNALFERPDGGTSQVDLIMISDKGIFVFEMKDYKGFITGNEYHTEWTQHLTTNKGKKKYKLRNPIKQNENHIKTIKSILNSEGISLPLYNVVVFGLTAVLGDISASVDVITLGEVDETINKYHKLMVDSQMLELTNSCLNEQNIDSVANREKHLAYVASISKNPDSTGSDKKRGTYKAKSKAKGKSSLKDELGKLNWDSRKFFVVLYLVIGLSVTCKV